MNHFLKHRLESHFQHATLDQRGPLDVLRHGMKDHGIKLSLAFFAPASTLSAELVAMHASNRLSVTRQLRYSATTGDELDLVLFVNGVPTATAELKNPLTGQGVEQAKAQYRRDRSPKELLFARRALVHFAVDPDLVFLTTRLTGPSTRFLPFNLGTGGPGEKGGAGNPTPASGYRTAYLWEQAWSPDNWLDLLRRFLHVEAPTGKGAKAGKKPWHTRTLIFPRLHQWHAVRALTDHAAEHGAGHNYLVEHSAGSGKSNTIAWLTHRLSSLHDAENSKVFHKVIVITDRVVLDRQLQDTIFQFDHTVGVVEKIDRTSAQLAQALSGETAQVIITTLQKFPFVLESAGKLAGSRFAVIVDEAHSSQTGETAKALKQVLAEGADATLTADGDAVLLAAEVADAVAEAAEDETDPLVSSALARGRHTNLSFFAFTATPKAKTLELFGDLSTDGKYRPFHVYSMRQAIEEGFILDVLLNYVTYATYYKLTRTAPGGATSSSDNSDREVDKRKAAALLARFASLHPSNMTQRAEIIVEHFRAHTAGRMGGRAKAMVVTRSRLHAVRTHAAIGDYIAKKGYPGLHALVAFSGIVDDGGVAYSETMLNGFPESALPERFNYTIAEDPAAGTPAAGQDREYHVLVVAEKYQTGFDQPLLTTMYVDKKLDGVRAVQTLSRLNRIHPLKSQDDIFVLDFANEAADIAEAFKPFYETTIAEPTDPNLLYASQTEVMSFGLLVESEMNSFATAFLATGAQAGAHGKLYHFTDPAKDRFAALLKDDPTSAEEFRSTLRNYTRAYAFLAQVIPYHDAELERLYLYGKALLQRLTRTHDGGVDLGAVDLSHLRIVKTGTSDVSLGEGGEEQIVPGFTGGGRGSQTTPELALIDQVIAAINERLGGNLTDADKVWVQQSFEYAAEDPQIQQAAQANTEDNFAYVFNPAFQGLVLDRHDANADLISRVFKDAATTDFFTELARRVVYEMARDAG